METENDMIVETLLGLSGASDEHMEEVLSAIPFFTEWNMLSLWDGLPVKSRLPPEVEAGFKTRNQWEEQNLCPKDDARPVRMHPSPRAKRIFYYYHVSDIGPFASMPGSRGICKGRRRNWTCPYPNTSPCL